MSNSTSMTSLSDAPAIGAIGVASLLRGVNLLGFQFSIIPQAQHAMAHLMPVLQKGRAQMDFWKTSMPPWAADYYYEQMWMKAKHRLSFGVISKHQMRSMEQKVRPCFKAALKISS